MIGQDHIKNFQNEISRLIFAYHFVYQKLI